jgi:hypothetical protein
MAEISSGGCRSLAVVAKSRYRQTVYLDEHIDPQAKELFEGQGLRAIRIAESRRKFLGI